MDIIVNPNIIRYMTRLLDRTSPMLQISDHIPEKPLSPTDIPIEQPFPRAKPEDKGVKSSTVRDFIYEVICDRDIKLHGIIIIKDGSVIYELDTDGHNGRMRHVCHSLSKSVTSMAIGMLVDEGRISLDDKVVKLLENRVNPLSTLGYRNLTVRHLLNMTSGASFAEVGTVVEKNWLKAYFESSFTFQPGKKFNYNSLNSYVLSCIVKEVTGQGLVDFLTPRLFAPLGIRDLHWERSPEGIENGGWGLYLRREDVCKLAQLYLDGGVWKGERLISEEWVKRSTSAFIKTPDDAGDFNYGYHIWSNKEKGYFLFNGMFGQDALVMKKQRMIIVTNGGIEQLFQQSEYYKLVDKYFYNEPPAPTYDIPLKRLTKELTGKYAKEGARRLFFKPLPKKVRKALGVVYNAPSLHGKPFKGAQTIGSPRGCGLMPLAEQLLRNTYATGIQSICLRLEDRQLYLDVDEYDSTKRLPIVPNKTVPTVVKFGQTQYRAAVHSVFSKDEHGIDVLMLRLELPEIASTRYLRVYFKDDSITVRMSEMPGLGLVRMFADSVENMLGKNKMIADMVSKIDSDILFLKLEKRFEPAFTLIRDK
jgi:CubicO group peptidase (beta-lactamase class C family)